MDDSTPARADGAGRNDVNLMSIFKSIDTSSFGLSPMPSQGQNSAAFSAAYRETLQACYGCHKASGLTCLRSHGSNRAAAVDHQL